MDRQVLPLFRLHPAYFHVRIRTGPIGRGILTIITAVPNLIMHRSRVFSQIRLGFGGHMAAGALESQAFMDGLHVCFERIGPCG